MKALLMLVLCLTCRSVFSFDGEYGKFSIHLLGEEFPSSGILHAIKKEDVRIKKTPLITQHDVVGINQDELTISLTSSSSDRLASLSVGTAFALVKDGKVVLLGRIWSERMSSSVDDVVLLLRSGGEPEKIRLSIGYPNQKCFQGFPPDLSGFFKAIAGITTNAGAHNRSDKMEL